MVWTDLKYHGGRAVLAALCLASLLVHSCLGAPPPPPNDLCTGAVVIPPGGPFPYWAPVISDVSGATTNGDPAPACVGQPERFASNGVWYVFTPSASAFYAFSTSFDTVTTVPYTAIAIYTSAHGCSGPFTSLICNENQSGTRAALSTDLTAATTYYIVVWRLYDFTGFPGQLALELRVTKPLPPPNDICAGAEIIPSGPLPQLSTTNDITKATTTGDPPAPTCQSDVTNSVWFRFTPTNSAGGTYVFSTDASTATTVYNPVMALYTGTCGGLNQVACDYQPEGRPTIVASNLTVGAPYYIVVWDWWDLDLPTPGETSVQLRVTRQRRPIVTTLAASSVASTSAVLNASINANYVTTRAWFDWGLTTNYGNITSSRLIGKGGGDVVTSTLITGLTPGALYHFRAVANNSFGTNYGGDQTFNTRPQITAWERQSDGSFRLQFAAMSGQVYRIDGATDLPDWTEVGVARDLGNGLYEFVDANAGRYAHRFYRVKGP